MEVLIAIAIILGVTAFTFLPEIVGFINGQIATRKDAKVLGPAVILSNKAKAVVRKNNELPVDHRLGPEITDVLANYDAKLGGVEKVNAHFSYYYGGTDCGCYRNCPMADYEVLIDSIDAIASALAQQKEALERAALAGITNNMPLLIERAREEASIITSVTKELS